jgi:pimeloyl-ACP methyl ester carboxylesterase
MSAGAAVWAAAEEPSLVRGIVLLGPFARNNPIGSNPKTAGVFKALFTLLFSRPWGPALWQRYYASLYPARKPEDLNAYMASLRANLSKPGRQEALIGMIRADKLASEQRLGRVAAPALVLMGGQDPDFKDPAAEAEWLAGALHGRAHLFPAAGHYPQAEFPAETAAVILAYLSALG